MDKQTTSPSLQVLHNDIILFQSDGKWLYPLFELENYLRSHPLNLSEALVRDKVIGKAAALLIVRFKPGHIHGVLISEPAVQVLENSGIPYSYDNQVERIDCQTEVILADIDDPETAYKILCERAKRC